MTSVDRERDSILLDLLRGSAAMYVVLFHCLERLTRHGNIVDVPGGSAHLIVSQFGAGVFGYGHYAVLVFFVLSGYVVHLRQARFPSQRNGLKRWRWFGHYLWRRLARIYPPLLFAIIITLLFDSVGSRTFPDFYSVYVHPHSMSSAFEIFFPSHYDRFGSNAPLWSIQYELIFYVLYVVVILTIADYLVSNALALSVGLTAVGLGLSFAFSFAHLPQPLWASAMVYLPIWASGKLLADLRCKSIPLRRPGVVAALGTLIIIYCATFSDNKTHVYLDYLWGLGIFLLMAVMMLRPPSQWSPNIVLREASPHFSVVVLCLSRPLSTLGFISGRLAVG